MDHRKGMFDAEKTIDSRSFELMHRKDNQHAQLKFFFKIFSREATNMRFYSKAYDDMIEKLHPR